jgi:DHA2 family multidrug resistance protein
MTEAISEHTETPLSLSQWTGFFCLAVGAFMGVLDIQVVTSSLVAIQSGLSATLEEIAWVQTAYLIAEVIVIPLSGWLARLLSTRLLFVISAGGFTLFSLLCALSWNLPSMIVFRSFQGFFGGALIPMSFTAVYFIFPKRLQSPMIIVLGMIITIAPTIGPVLGGYLTENFNWESLFLVNILPGLCIAFLAWKNLDIDRPDWTLLKKIDFTGIILIAVFLGSLQYILEEGTQKQWFDDTSIIVLTLVCVISGVSMLFWELKIPEPIVDLRAFGNINFSLGCMFAFVIGIGLFSMIFYTSIYLSSIKDLNSQQIGTYLMIGGIFQFVSSLFAGSLEKKMDLRWLLFFGISLYASGAWMNGYLTVESGYWEFFWPQAVRGLALIMCFLPSNKLALASLPLEKVKNASGLYNLMLNLGGAIGMAVSNTYLEYLTKAHYAQLRDAVTANSLPAQDMLQGLTEVLTEKNLPSPELSALKELTFMVWQQAKIIGFNNIFQIIAVIFVVSLLAIPFLKKADAESVSVSH